VVKQQAALTAQKAAQAEDQQHRKQLVQSYNAEITAMSTDMEKFNTEPSEEGLQNALSVRQKLLDSREYSDAGLR
jgi:hypothetical protein